jgi:hypothetical protein
MIANIRHWKKAMTQTCQLSGTSLGSWCEMTAYGLLIDMSIALVARVVRSPARKSTIMVGKWGIRVLDDGPWEIEPKRFNWNKIPVPTDLAIFAWTAPALGVSRCACITAWQT